MFLTTHRHSPVNQWVRHFWNEDATGEESFSPRANVYQDAEAYHIDLELPGIKKEEVQIEVKDSRLTVSGERKNEVKGEGKDFIRFESFYGKFERSWILEDIDEDKIVASAKDGIYHLTLPKREEVKRRHEVKKIEIQ